MSLAEALFAGAAQAAKKPRPKQKKKRKPDIESIRAAQPRPKSKPPKKLAGIQKKPIASMYRAGNIPKTGAIATKGLQALSDLGTSIVYAPAGVYQAEEAVRKDVKAAVGSGGLVRGHKGGGDLSFKRSRKLGKTVLKQAGQDIRHPLRRPGLTIIDALAAVGGGASVAARGASGASRFAAERTAGASVTKAAAKAAVGKRPMGGKQGSLLHRRAPGRIEIAPGVHKNLSRNPLAAAVQRRQVKAMKRKPESHTAKGVPGRNLPETVGYERRRTQQILEAKHRAPAAALAQRARKLNRHEQTAVRVVAEGKSIPDRIAAHQRDMQTADRASRKALARKIQTLKEVQKRGLVEHVNGKPQPSAKLAELYARAKASGTAREEIMKETGLSTEERLAQRRNAPARVIEGAKFEKTPAQKARVAQVREYKVGEKQIERPRTEAEAKTRLATLDKQYAAAVRGIEEKLTGGQPADPVETGRRNLYNLKSKNRRRGRPKMITQKQEVRRMAEAELHRIAEKHAPHDPAMAKVASIIEERHSLREQLSDPERHFGETAPKGFRDPNTIPVSTRMGPVTFKSKGDQVGPEYHATYTAHLSDGTPVGRVDVSYHGDEAAIRMIEVPEKYRRQGVATALIHRIRNEQPGVRLTSLGDVTTKEGRAFIASGRGGAPKKPAEFGTVSETVPGKTIRRALPAKEAKKALARLVGAEGTQVGDLYVPYGQRRRSVRTGRAQTGSASGIGIPKTPESTRHTFTGKSLQTGHFRDDAVRAIAEGELEAQRYRSVLRARNAVVKDSISADELLNLPAKVQDRYVPVRITGKPYSGETRQFVDAIQGKLDEGVQLTRQERKDLGKREDTIRAWAFPEMERAEQLAAAARGEVRFVDKRRLGGLNESQGIHGKVAGPAGVVTDEVNAAMQMAILYAKPAYLTPNLLGQTALALIEQGPIAPWNLSRGVRLYQSLTPEERWHVRGLIGQGLAHGAQPKGRYATRLRGWSAEKYSKVLDSPFRWPSFVHEARMMGYDTPAKIKTLLNDARHQDDLVEIAKRTRDAMIDYENLSPLEQKFLRRMIFFYPWVKGSTTFTGRFLRDHPIQAAATVQLGRQGKEKAMRDLGPGPWYTQGQFQVGGGKPGQPNIVDPRAAQLFDYPVQFGQALKSLVSGEPKTAGAQISDFLSPGARLPGQLLYPHDPLGGYQLSVPEALKREYLTGLPQARLYEGIKHPTADNPDVLNPTSPKTAVGRFAVGGVYPHPTNLDVRHARAAAEGRAAFSPEQRAYRDVFAERQQVFEAAKRYMPEELKNGKLPPELRQAYNRSAEVARTRSLVEQDTKPKTVERERGKYQAEVALLQKWSVVTAADASAAVRWARTASRDDIAKQRDRMRSTYLKAAYWGIISYAKAALIAKGASFG